MRRLTIVLLVALLLALFLFGAVNAERVETDRPGRVSTPVAVDATRMPTIERPTPTATATVMAPDWAGWR